MLDIIYSIVFQDGHVYIHSKVMDASGGLGARKTDILKKIDLQDPTDSDSQIVLEHVILCGAPITNNDWTVVKGDKDKSRVTLSKLIEFMNVFSDEISKTTFDEVPEIHSTINDEYDDVRTNPFTGIALWKMVTTLYAGSDMLRRDALWEQLMNATHIPLKRTKDVPDWLNNLRNIFKEFVQAHGNTGNSYIIANDLVMAKTLTLLTQGQFAQGEDIPDWAKVDEVAKIIRDQRETGKLTDKQFYTLYDKVTDQTNSLFYGVQSSYNKLDPYGPAAMRSARLPAGIRGLAAVEGDEVGFYVARPTSAEEYRRITLTGNPTTPSATLDTTQKHQPTINTKDKVADATHNQKPMWKCKEFEKQNFSFMKDGITERKD